MNTANHLIKLLAISLLLLLLGACQESSNPVSTTTSNAEQPAKLFALMDLYDNSSQFNSYLQLTAVDGIAVRTTWDDIQPTNETSYNWDQIDNAFALAKSMNKKVTLHIVSAVYGDTPAWVYSAGAQSYTYQKQSGEIRTDPIPWDSTYLTKWAGFLNALRDHLATLNYTSQLEYISVAAPVPEMSLVACKQGDLNSDYSGSTAYSRTDYQNAWKNVILATNNAFPSTKKLLPAPVRDICFRDTDGGAFYQELFNYANTLSPGTFMHFATDLNAVDSGSWRLDQITSVIKAADVGLQYTWSYSQDNGNKLGGTLLKATCDKGIKNFNGRYFEVYKADLDSSTPSVQSAIKAIHEPSTCP